MVTANKSSLKKTLKILKLAFEQISLKFCEVMYCFTLLVYGV